MRRKQLIIGIAALTAAAFSGMMTVPLYSSGVGNSFGDVSGDGVVNAGDAAEVLVAAANAGAGEDLGLTAEEQTAADVNHDAQIDALDAALILQYAATCGAGYGDSLEAFLKAEEQSAAESTVNYLPLLRSLKQIDPVQQQNDFRISETGVTGAPEGLADAVTYDFDRDGTEELVTFRFTENAKSGTDVAAELYTWKNGESMLLDTLYLTDFLDLTESNRRFADTVFFAESMSMQIVSVDDGNTLYFGTLLNAENNLNFYQRTYPKAFGVFTVENGKFVEKMVGSTENFITSHEPCNENGVVAAKILPPSLEGKLAVSDCYVDESLFRSEFDTADSMLLDNAKEDCDNVNKLISGIGRVLLCADVDHVTDSPLYIRGGDYANVRDAYAALFQDFSMRLSVESDRFPGVLLKPADGARMNPILTVFYAEKYGEPDDGAICTFAYGKNLDRLLFLNGSELEGTALFADILRNPDTYPMIWERFDDAEYRHTIGYYVTDFDGDGAEEMAIAYTDDKETLYADTVFFVDGDGTVIGSEIGSPVYSLLINEQGIAQASASAGHYTCFDLRHMEHCFSYGSVSGQYFSNYTNGAAYEGIHAIAEEFRVTSVEVGEDIVPQMHLYQWGELDSLEVDKRTAPLLADSAYPERSDWQNSYLDLIDLDAYSGDEKDFALIDLGGEAPALVINDSDTLRQYIYQYNGRPTHPDDAAIQSLFVRAYCPGSNEFLVEDVTAGGESLHLYEYADGAFTEKYSLLADPNMQEPTVSYFIANQEVTEAEYRKIVDKFTEEPVWCSLYEIEQKLAK